MFGLLQIVLEILRNPFMQVDALVSGHVVSFARIYVEVGLSAHFVALLDERQGVLRNDGRVVRADYYLQFAVLFIPMIFYNDVSRGPVNVNAARPALAFNQRSIKALVLMLSVILLWWYNYTCLGTTQSAVDDFTNFRFMWEV